MSKDERFSYLLSLYREGRISEKENDEFFGMLLTNKYDHIVNNCLDESFNKNEFISVLPEDLSEKTYQEIFISPEKNNGKYRAIKNVSNWLAAASVVLFLIGCFYLYARLEPKHTFAAEFKKNSPEKIINTTKHSMLVKLPDGSKVSLEPNSTIFFSRKHFANKREVYMEGEAFFEVIRNPKKPFQVYYDKVVTKVLGTSFKIKKTQSSNVEVEVLTGKVQVFKNQLIDSSDPDKGLFITPNQKAIYNDENQSLSIALVDQPCLIKTIHNPEDVSKAETKGFVYDNASLTDIMKEIELGYGVEIITNNEKLKDVVFSGDISKYGLFDKLKVICLATNTDYEIKETTISIKAK